MICAFFVPRIEPARRALRGAFEFVARRRSKESSSNFISNTTEQ